jgi:hypothetical protein
MILLRFVFPERKARRPKSSAAFANRKKKEDAARERAESQRVISELLREDPPPAPILSPEAQGTMLSVFTDQFLSALPLCPWTMDTTYIVKFCCLF